MTTRTLLVVLVIALCFSGRRAVEARRTWVPAVAVTDAERDIAAGRIRFCYIGGYVSHAPGLPEKGYAVAKDYPRIAVGPQGCTRDEHYETDAEYSTRYNKRMWHFLMSRPDLWK